MTEPGTQPPVPAEDGMGPTGAGERVEIIDVIRGFAVFGILLVNMGMFNSPQALAASGIEWWPDPLNRLARLVIVFFAEGKFYSTFSTLFGLGLAIQAARARARGAAIERLYITRILILLLIGLTHAFLVWWGDILTMYALLGLLLVFFVDCKPKTLLIWTGVLLLIPIVLCIGIALLLLLLQAFPEVTADTAAQIETTVRQNLESSMQAYAHGTFREIAMQRASDVALVYQNLPIFGPMILALFLIGLTLGKVNFFRDLPVWIPHVRRWLPWLAAVGLIGNVIYALAHSLHSLSPGRFLGAAVLVVAAPALAYTYVSTLVLLWQRPGWRGLLSWLAPVGRMALTNYLLQSVVCTLLFYNYGLGLYGRVSPAVGLVLTVTIFAVQIPLSAWWLRRFRFGPMEWVWRSLTYGRPQPMAGTRSSTTSRR
jgi:uncharacterized protein